nr:hypothetical protein [Micromonospora rifamycinica]
MVEVSDPERGELVPFGNITKQVDTRYEPATTAETQCYRYDALRQLTSAWTATDNCTLAPSGSNRGMVGSGISPASAYWTEWTVDTLGNRQNQKQYSLSGGTDITTTYAYDGNSKGQPHTLTSTATSGGLTGTTSYTYDKTGNMATRSAGQGNQTLSWDEAAPVAVKDHVVDGVAPARGGHVQ